MNENAIHFLYLLIITDKDLVMVIVVLVALLMTVVCFQYGFPYFII